jgi:DNA polymerase delta subunit 1
MLRFQALSWELQQKTPRQWARNGESQGEREFRESAMVLHVCGRTIDGETVRVAVLGHHCVIYARCTMEQFERVKRKATHYDKQFDDWWVVSVTQTTQKVYQGFRNGETDRVLEITAANVNVARGLASCLENNLGCELFNTKVDVMCAFFHRTQIKPCGWIDVLDVLEMNTLPFDYAESRCDHDHIVQLDQLVPVDAAESANKVAPFSIMGIDIEACCPCGDDGMYPFPQALEPHHRISCICARMRTMAQQEDPQDVYFSFAQVDTDTVRQISNEHGMHLNESSSVAGTGEREMLIAFVRFFEKSMPDIVTGWNTLNFDMQYIFKRCKLHNISLSTLGKFSVWRPKLRKGQLSTAGAGHNEYEYFEIPGVFQLDQLFAVRREMNLDSYSLNACAEKFLGDTKIDEPPSEIHRKSQGTPVELAEIVAYCIKDSALADEIAKKLKSYIKMFMFANLAMVPIGYLLVRGANVKTYSFIAEEVYRRSMIISDKHRMFNELDGKYSGATVLEAMSGFYRDDPVATLDFKSLYPSIIISQQLDPHTYVEDAAYLGLPHVQYKRFCWNDEKTGKRYNHVIVTNGAEIGCAPVVPSIMHRLWSERDAAKKKMKQATDPFEKSIYDGMQLAIKVLMNSIYGFFGAVNTNSMAHLPVAMLTTYMGRMLIGETQRYVLARFGDFPTDRPDLATLDDRLLKTQDELEEANSSTTGLSNVYGDTGAPLPLPTGSPSACPFTFSLPPYSRRGCSSAVHRFGLHQVAHSRRGASGWRSGHSHVRVRALRAGRGGDHRVPEPDNVSCQRAR